MVYDLQYLTDQRRFQSDTFLDLAAQRLDLTSVLLPQGSARLASCPVASSMSSMKPSK